MPESAKAKSTEMEEIITNYIGECFYRYGQWNANTQACIERDEIYFCPPGQFNDPFDCYLSPSFRRATKGQRMDKLREHFYRQHPHLGPVAVERKLANATRHRQPKQTKEWESYCLRLRDTRFGILCLTTDPVNSVMWAHYGANHSGICVGLGVNAITEYLFECLRDPAVSTYLHKIVYTRDMPTWEYFIDDSVEAIRRAVTTKDSHWGYEEEYRLVRASIGREMMDGDRVDRIPGAVQEVILGLNTGPETRREVMAAIKKSGRRIRLYQACRLARRYQLGKRKLSL